MTTVELSIGERVLQNGLTALAVQNPGVATAAAAVVLRVGVLDELASERGLANLVGACLEEGTTRRSAEELSQAVENIGGSITGAPNGATIQSPAEEIGKAVRLLREFVFEPAFPAREVKRVQQETLAEIQAELEDPRYVARRRFRELVYGAHPYASPDQGTPETVIGFRPSDLRRFHRKWFVPKDGYVAIAGPAEVDESLDLLAKTFRSQRGPAPRHEQFAPPVMPSKIVDEHIPMDREQVHVYLGHPGVRRTDPDFYALLVMDHILGTGPGFTSRIAKKLRDELGLCYSVFASTTSTAGVEPGVFTAYLATSSKHRRRAVAGFCDEIRRVRDALPSARELADVQDYLTGSFVFGLERNSNLVGYAVRAKKFDLGFDYLHRFGELISAVTREDVRRVAGAHLDPDRVVIVSAGAGAR